MPKNTQAKTLGQRLRLARQAAKLTQAELAKKAKTSQDYVSDLERDKSSPGVGVLARLAAACRVSVADLV